MYKRIVSQLHTFAACGTIDGYDAYLIASMTVKVVTNLAKDYENIVKGVKVIMDDGFIDYPGRKEYLAARKEGLIDGAVNMCIDLVKDGLISLAEAAKRLNMSEDKIKTYL